jgi:hypothetical protein
VSLRGTALSEKANPQALQCAIPFT